MDHLIRPPGDVPPWQPQEPRSRMRWVAGAILVIVVAAGAYYVFHTRRTTEGPITEAPERTAPPSTADNPLGGQGEPVELPPLDESDALVRRLVGALSRHPVVAKWLVTNGLIRNFVVVVENISTGALPTRHLRSLRPAGPFRVVEKDTRLYVDPRSHARYTNIADAASSIDAAGAAKLYATLKPRIEEAYRELGHEGSFDRALEGAILVLLRTPAANPEVIPSSRGIGYSFAATRLESLSPSQKLLLRMGIQNLTVIQRKLREIALALGIPAEKLPATS